ncbi:MAG: DUF2723 domain-containing protein, partial [Desulfobacterota bacterium]|nr:DUF2723 domain-containing protein [Thermodesulfobacteriota bacterium]
MRAGRHRKIAYHPLPLMDNPLTSKNRIPLWILWCCAVIIFSVLYLLTAQRGVSWQDSGMFQWRIISGDIIGHLGIALAHPFYIILGRLVLLLPGTNTMFKINSMSGVCMAIALANLLVITARYSGKIMIGIATVMLVAVMHTVWWLATVAEVYSMQLAIFTTELLILFRLLEQPSGKTAVLLFFFNGLGLSIHNLALLPLPVYIIAVVTLARQKKLKPATFLLILTAYTAGASLFISLIIKHVSMHGDIVAALQSALVGIYAQAVFNMHFFGNYFLVNAGLISLNFINIMLPCAMIGWLSLKRNIGLLPSGLIMAITIIEALFVIRYPVPDQFTFLLPTIAMIALAAAIGISVLTHKSDVQKRLVIAGCIFSILMPPFVYAAIPMFAARIGIEVQRPRELPFRDELRYWIVPWKHNERSAELFARTALSESVPDGTIICDGTSLYPLKITQRLEQLAPHVRLTTTFEIKRELQSRNAET